MNKRTNITAQFVPDIIIQAKRLFLGFLLATAIPVSYAEDYQQSFGQYQVYYSVFNSDFITPEVARQYGLKRSKSLALVNISVVDQESGKSISASIQGSAINLIGQSKRLAFREIKEQDAVYYIAELRYTNEEKLRFRLSVSPDGIADKFELNFEKKIYVN